MIVSLSYAGQGTPDDRFVATKEEFLIPISVSPNPRNIKSAGAVPLGRPGSCRDRGSRLVAFLFGDDPSFFANRDFEGVGCGKRESVEMNETRMRVGLGHDRHRLVPGRRLILGGVTIDYEMGLDGHSDADVLLHAVTDALLGAAGLGDIGEWFPNTDPRWANVDSAIFLQQAVREVQNRGWKIVNLDCTIHAERPKLSAYKKSIAHQIALLLNLDPSQVNVKAKTGERVGPVGRQEAIDADAIVLLAGADDPARDAGSVRTS